MAAVLQTDRVYLPFLCIFLREKIMICKNDVLFFYMRVKPNEF